MQTQNQKSTEKMSMGLSTSIESCIKSCLETYKISSSLLSHCLEKGGKHADPKHIKLLGDCARICNLSADFMIRQSDFYTSTCKVCAEVCTQCALSCESIADDEMMRACVEACRKCATSCEEMTKMN